MAEEQTTQAMMAPEQIAAAQQVIFDDRNKIIDRLMPMFYEGDTVPACVEASKYFFAYFVTQVLEGARMSGRNVNPDALLDGFVEGFKAEVVNIHSQLLMMPAEITKEDLAKLH